MQILTIVYFFLVRSLDLFFELYICEWTDRDTEQLITWTHNDKLFGAEKFRHGK